MTYLSDRRTKRVKTVYRLVSLFILAIIVIFWVHIRIFLSPMMFAISSRVFAVKMSMSETTDSISSWFSSKKVLEETITLLETENSAMKNEIAEKDALIASYDDAYKTSTKVTGSTIEVSALFSPLTSLYGTFLISKGFSDDIEEGLVVYTSGYVPLGKVVKVGTRASEVQLLSASGVEIEGIVVGSTTSGAVLRLTGIGGGDYIATLPKDVSIDKDATVMWKEYPKMKLGVVVMIDNEPQAISQKLLVRGLYLPATSQRLYIDLP